MYQLMNKNKLMFSFHIEDGKAVIDKSSLDFYPFGIRSSYTLHEWLLRRRPSKNRAHLVKLFRDLNFEDMNNYLNVTKALGLNDTLWVKREDEDVKFENVSLYRSSFNELLAKYALSGAGELDNSTIHSAEYTTGGDLDKCWVREPDGIYLLKSGTREFESEFLCSQILEVLGLDHVHYSLDEYDSFIVSKCKIITSEDVGLLPISQFMMMEEFQGSSKLFASLGVPEFMDDMRAFDALVCNVDRHYNNFSVMFDNDTLELLSPAPLYDHGQSLLFRSQLRSVKAAVKVADNLIPKTYDDFLNIEITDYMRERLKRLSKFKFKNDENYPIDQKRLSILNELVLYRANLLLSM